MVSFSAVVVGFWLPLALAPLTLLSALTLTSVDVLSFPLVLETTAAFFSATTLPLPFTLAWLVGLAPAGALPCAFFTAAGLALPFFAGAAVALDLAAPVGLILDSRVSTMVGFALDSLGALVGIGGLMTSLYGPDLAGLAGVGLVFARVDLEGAAFPVRAFF